MLHALKTRGVKATFFVLIDRGRITQSLSRYVAGGWDDAGIAG